MRYLIQMSIQFWDLFTFDSGSVKCIRGRSSTLVHQMGLGKNMLIIIIMKTQLFGQEVVILRLKQNIKSTSQELSKRHLGIVPRTMLRFPDKRSSDRDYRTWRYHVASSAIKLSWPFSCVYVCQNKKGTWRINSKPTLHIKTSGVEISVKNLKTTD